jgi:predicted DNA-binding transcriptional regulator YafY
MSKQTAVTRYFLIINRLRKRKQSFKELNDYLQIQSEVRGYHYTTTIRTFQREKNEIRNIFGIDIQCDSENIYFINEEESPAQLQQQRLLESYELLNILGTADLYKDKLFLETRKPKGIEHIFGILHAIKNNLVINTSHTNFSDGSEYSKTLKPIAVKESQGRWYVIAEDSKDAALKTFALDRITDFEITREKFEKPSLNMEQWFNNSFGIIKPANEKPQVVKLSFSFRQGQYIKSFALHKSQQIELENKDDDEVVVSLEVFITEDFIMELLKYGNEVKILEPLSLVQKIKQKHQQAFEQY